MTQQKEMLHGHDPEVDTGHVMESTSKTVYDTNTLRLPDQAHLKHTFKKVCHYSNTIHSVLHWLAIHAGWLAGAGSAGLKGEAFRGNITTWHVMEHSARK